MLLCVFANQKKKRLWTWIVLLVAAHFLGFKWFQLGLDLYLSVYHLVWLLRKCRKQKGEFQQWKRQFTQLCRVAVSGSVQWSFCYFGVLHFHSNHAGKRLLMYRISFNFLRFTLDLSTKKCLSVLIIFYGFLPYNIMLC